VITVKDLLRGKSGQMPSFPNVLALFLNYRHEISFNPKTLQQVYRSCSHKSVRICFAIFKVNVKKKNGGGGGGRIDEF